MLYSRNGRKDDLVVRGARVLDPAEGVDAVQLELSQRNYMDEDSFEYDEARAGRLLPTLRALLGAALAG